MTRPTCQKRDTGATRQSAHAPREQGSRRSTKQGQPASWRAGEASRRSLRVVSVNATAAGIAQRSKRGLKQFLRMTNAHMVLG